MKEMRLTPLEMEILQHRLDVPCAIAEVLMADWDEFTADGYSEVEDAINAMTIDKETGLVQWETELQQLIIHDCVIDDVYVDAAQDNIGVEISQQKFNAIRRAKESLEEKFEVFQ